MLCTDCNKNMASVFYEHTVNGKTNSLSLCSECAKKRGILSSDMLFSEILSIPFKVKSTPTSHKVCSLCGSDETNFIRDGKVSCPVCYETFETELESPIKRIHSNVSHIGRAPAKYKKQSDKKRVLEGLKRQLEQAVKNQEYENAAVLRDKIREIEACE
ncbi:MAG: hypothetical protein E7635_02655 [Ruminococcaceae bacterium]|nr:hypothetical protein [Oscillospiraceae bacterium]